MNYIGIIINKLYYLLAPVRFYLSALTANPWVFAKITLTAAYLQIFSVFAPYYSPGFNLPSEYNKHKFLYGFNLLSDNYGHVLSENFLFHRKSSFDITYFSSTFRISKLAGADIIKISLFSGLQGIVIDETNALSKELSPELLKNLERVLLLAKFYKIKIYLGLINGSDSYRVHNKQTSLRSFFFNLFSKKSNGLKLYEEKVLAPLLHFLNNFNANHPGTIYGVDLFNEIEGATRYGYFLNPWEDSREWIKNITTFAKTLSPNIKFTVSGAWDNPTLELLSGYFSDLNLDFYDIHLYSDQGHIRFINFICTKIIHDKKSIILGEYGQISETRNDELQLSSTKKYLSATQNSCFSAALAWHIGGHNDYLAYLNNDGSFRPATIAIRG